MFGDLFRCCDSRRPNLRESDERRDDGRDCCQLPSLSLSSLESVYSISANDGFPPAGGVEGEAEALEWPSSRHVRSVRVPGVCDSRLELRPTAISRLIRRASGPPPMPISPLPLPPSPPPSRHVRSSLALGAPLGLSHPTLHLRVLHLRTIGPAFGEVGEASAGVTGGVSQSALSVLPPALRAETSAETCSLSPLLALPSHCEGACTLTTRCAELIVRSLPEGSTTLDMTRWPRRGQRTVKRSSAMPHAAMRLKMARARITARSSPVAPDVSAAPSSPSAC